ncbi:MAG: hypothetical protein ACOWWM_10045 [Desulfobacterales bacterium]
MILDPAADIIVYLAKQYLFGRKDVAPDAESSRSSKMGEKAWRILRDKLSGADEAVLLDLEKNRYSIQANDALKREILHHFQNDTESRSELMNLAVLFSMDSPACRHSH